MQGFNSSSPALWLIELLRRFRLVWHEMAAQKHVLHRFNTWRLALSALLKVYALGGSESPYSCVRLVPKQWFFHYFRAWRLQEKRVFHYSRAWRHPTQYVLHPSRAIRMFLYGFIFLDYIYIYKCTYI